MKRVAMHKNASHILKILWLFFILGIIYSQGKPTLNRQGFSQKSKIHYSSLKKKLSKIYGDIEISNLLDKHFTPNKNYYQFVPVTDSTYKIHWGNDLIENYSINLYYDYHGIRQSLDWENKNFISIKGWSGSDSWYSIILPIKKGANDFEISNPLAKSKNLELIVSEYDSFNDTVLKVINLKNRKESFIVDKQIHCSSACLHYCIDTIMINDKEIFVNWVIPNYIEEPHKTIKKKYKIYFP